MRILLTTAAAIWGGLLFYKMKVPAGAMIGAILSTAAFNFLTGMGEFPPEIKVVVQAIAGGFIGQRITRGDLKEMKNILGASVLMFVCMTGYTLLVGGVMARFTQLDLATALASTMPAGLNDTAIISADVGADPVQSTVMQMVRMLFSVILLPQLGFRICARWNPAPVELDPTNVPGYKSPEIKTWSNAICTVALAVGCGLLGKASGIPAGAMIAAVFAVAGLNVWKGRAYLPKGLKLAAQCAAGAIIGSGITTNDVANMRLLLFPVLILTASLLICNYVCAWMLHKLCGLDISTSIFGAIPAGVSDMALISADMGGDAPKAAVLHLVRYVGMLGVMPSIIKAITG